MALNPPLQGSHYSTLWQHVNVILQGLWDPPNKGILLWLSYYWKFLRLWLKNTWIPVFKFSSLWRPENAIPAVSWNPRLEDNWLQDRHSSGSWQTENEILKCHEMLESKVSCFRCFTLLHFEGLKKRFLNCPETLGSNLCSFRLSYNIHFGDLKMRFLEGREILSSSVHGFSWKRLKHFGDLKCDYSRIMRLAST